MNLRTYLMIKRAADELPDNPLNDKPFTYGVMRRRGDNFDNILAKGYTDANLPKILKKLRKGELAITPEGLQALGYSKADVNRLLRSAGVTTAEGYYYGNGTLAKKLPRYSKKYAPHIAGGSALAAALAAKGVENLVGIDDDAGIGSALAAALAGGGSHYAAPSIENMINPQPGTKQTLVDLGPNYRLNKRKNIVEALGEGGKWKEFTPKMFKAHPSIKFK